MSNAIESPTAPATRAGVPDVPPVERRGTMGLLARGGMAVVAAAAGLFAVEKPAAAFACCHLSNTRTCKGRCHFTCPSGYHRRVWGCTSGSRAIWCGECAKGSTCWNGPFYCNYGWDDGYC